jgi:hypothetical protein
MNVHGQRTRPSRWWPRAPSRPGCCPWPGRRGPSRSQPGSAREVQCDVEQSAGGQSNAKDVGAASERGSPAADTSRSSAGTKNRCAWIARTVKCTACGAPVGQCLVPARLIASAVVPRAGPSPRCRAGHHRQTPPVAIDRGRVLVVSARQDGAAPLLEEPVERRRASWCPLRTRRHWSMVSTLAAQPEIVGMPTGTKPVGLNHRSRLTEPARQLDRVVGIASKGHR